MNMFQNSWQNVDIYKKVKNSFFAIDWFIIKSGQNGPIMSFSKTGYKILVNFCMKLKDHRAYELTNTMFGETLCPESKLELLSFNTIQSVWQLLKKESIFEDISVFWTS